MPYKQLTKIKENKKLYCIKKTDSGKTTCFGSIKKRKTGIRIREAFSHGWKPTKLK